MDEHESDLIVLTVERPDEELFDQSRSLMELAQDYKITSPEEAIEAADDLKAVKALAKEINKKRLAITGPINKALKEVNALFKPAKDWLSEAEKLIKNKLLAFQREQERIARKLQVEADERAREERSKLEEAAIAAEWMGETEEAEELREEVEVQEAPVVVSIAPKIEGITTRITWKGEVTDKLLFVKYIAEKRNDLLELIKIDQSALNAQARSLKEELDIPGIKAVPEETIVARS
ncbi:MAG TPA: hypothetical protein ENI23_07530 [bacterium]|nr:hypothetical protein [bacterium]